MSKSRFVIDDTAQNAIVVEQTKPVCEMCGKDIGEYRYRWYEYDNGEKFRALVCFACAWIHDSLVQSEGSK